MKKGKIFAVFLVLCFFVMACAMPTFWGVNSVSADENTHAVTFDFNLEKISKYVPPKAISNLENHTVSVEGGKKATPNCTPSPSLSPYYSMAWTLGGNVVDLSTVEIFSDTTFVAKWTPKQYRVYLNFESESVRQKVSNYQDGFMFTIETGRVDLYRPKIKGYTFMGWYPSSSPSAIEILYIPAGSVGDQMLTARFEPTEYIIDYHTDATNDDNPTHYNVEDDPITLYEPSKRGHIFKGWFSDSDCTIEISHLDTKNGGKIDVYPMWELEKYTVTFTLPSGEKVNQTVEYGKNATLPKLQKSIFEIVVTSVSTKNITEDTQITIRLVNIWYVYVIALALIAGVITTIVIVKTKQKNTHNKLRLVYQSSSRKKRY